MLKENPTYQALIDQYHRIINDFCGGHSIRTIKLGLYRLSAEDNLAKMYFYMLSAQHHNVMAKEETGKVASSHYSKKHHYIKSAMELCKEVGYTYGYQQTSDNFSTANMVIYFDVPHAGQISFHTIISKEIKEDCPVYEKEWDQLPESTFPKLCSGIKELYIDKFDSEFVDSLMNNDEDIEEEIKAAYKARIKEYVLEKRKRKAEQQAARLEKAKIRRGKYIQAMEEISTPENIVKFFGKFRQYAERKKYKNKFFVIKYDDNGLLRTQHSEKRFNYMLNPRGTVSFENDAPKKFKEYGYDYKAISEIMLAETGEFLAPKKHKKFVPKEGIENERG